MNRLFFFAYPLLTLTLASGCSKSTEEPPASGATTGTTEQKSGATQPASLTKGNPVACAACEKERCSQVAGSCSKLEGVAAAGPRQGTKKSVLCEETTACIKQSQCAAKEFHDCYCGGESSDPMSCLGGKATGACRAQFEASLETADPGEVALRFAKRDYAGGNALAPMVCRREECEAECSGVPY